MDWDSFQLFNDGTIADVYYGISHAQTRFSWGKENETTPGTYELAYDENGIEFTDPTKTYLTNDNYNIIIKKGTFTIKEKPVLEIFVEDAKKQVKGSVEFNVYASEETYYPMVDRGDRYAVDADGFTWSNDDGTDLELPGTYELTLKEGAVHIYRGTEEVTDKYEIKVNPGKYVILGQKQATVKFFNEDGTESTDYLFIEGDKYDVEQFEKVGSKAWSLEFDEDKENGVLDKAYEGEWSYDALEAELGHIDGKEVSLYPVMAVDYVLFKGDVKVGEGTLLKGDDAIKAPTLPKNTSYWSLTKSGKKYKGDWSYNAFNEKGLFEPGETVSFYAVKKSNDDTYTAPKTGIE